MNITAKSGLVWKSALWTAMGSLVLLTSVGCSNDDNDQPDPEINRPVPNPYLSAPLYGITHIDSSQSDSTPYGPPDGQFTINPAQQPIIYGGPRQHGSGFLCEQKIRAMESCRRTLRCACLFCEYSRTRSRFNPSGFWRNERRRNDHSSDGCNPEKRLWQ